MKYLNRVVDDEIKEKLSIVGAVQIKDQSGVEKQLVLNKWLKVFLKCRIQIYKIII